MMDKKTADYVKKVHRDFKRGKKKSRPNMFLGVSRYDWKWSKGEKERARCVFICGIIEQSVWLKTDPKLPESLRRVKYPNGLYGIEIIINDR